MILGPYPDDEKKRFRNKSVVNALFNVAKSKSKDVKYHLKDHQISYILIRKMLDYCIGTYSSKRPVTLKVAKQEYTKFVGDPKGETSPVIDLNKLTVEFGDKLEELMTNGYLDVQAGFTKSDVLDEENGVAGTDKPRVETHNVKSKDGKEQFRVWVIYNPISKVYKLLLEKSMNEAMFTQGLGVKEKAFIRVAFCFN